MVDQMPITKKNKKAQNVAKKTNKSSLSKKKIVKTDIKKTEKTNKILKKETIKQNVSKNVKNSKVTELSSPKLANPQLSKDGCTVDNSGNIQFKEKVYYLNSSLAGKKVEIIQHRGILEARSLENPNIYYELLESKKKA